MSVALAGGGAAGAGNSGAAGGTAGAAGGAPEGGAGAAGAAGAGSAGAGAAGAPGASDWTSGLPELSRGYIQNKGWKSPGEIVESYKSLESNFGVPENQLLKLPKDESDAEGWNKTWNKLGRPEKPEGYGLKDKEGKANDFQKWASETFHGAGLTAKQAQAVVTRWDAHVAEQNKAQETAFNQKVEQEIAGLKSEWGMAHDQNMKQAQAAARSLGVTDQVIDALEKQMGYSATMKLFQKVGSKIGEGDFVTGDRGNSFGSAMTPEAAKAKIEEIKLDADFQRKWREGGVKEKNELERLHRYAYPESSS